MTESFLQKKLLEYSHSDYYGFHMPGGKRNPSLKVSGLPYDLDITEIDGFDDLHHPQGIIKKIEQRASDLFGSGETALLVNGSTAGILSAIFATTDKGDTILVARNCHKSVYHGIILNELKPIYLYPKFDSKTQLSMEITPREVEEALARDPSIKAVMITSPTFDGVVSDVQQIADMVHKFGIPLIVDEAHGAHFGFHPGFPQNANYFRADVVIHSLHKTLPSLTQTALIHRNGNLVRGERLRFYLQIFQSSSPSYVLMASIDYCLSLLEAKEQRKDLFETYWRLLTDTRNQLSKLSHLKLLETKNYDPSKILISTQGTKETGLSLYQHLLKDFHLQLEMAAGAYALAMTSICDTPEGMGRLLYALKKIDHQMDKSEDKRLEGEHVEGLKESFPPLESVMLPWEGIKFRENPSYQERIETKAFRECTSQVVLEFAYLYPPGIPLVVPGERISLELVNLLESYEALGFKLSGIKKNKQIEVIKV